MIKIIQPTERDISALRDLQSQGRVSQPTQPKDYRKTVVLKPWGYEFLLFENELVAAWFLHIKGGHSTSMHCHPKKKTSLILLSGLALSYTFSQRTQLSAFEAVIIEKGVFHSTQSLSTHGIDLIEVETPPSKTDLVRLQDKYGRESTGYEGLSEMVTTGLDRYRYFHFDEKSPTNKPHKTHLYSVSLTAPSNTTLNQQVAGNDYSLYCLCRGSINSKQQALANTGDVVGAINLKKEAFSLEEPSTLLQMSPKLAA